MAGASRARKLLLLEDSGGCAFDNGFHLAKPSSAIDALVAVVCAGYGSVCPPGLDMAATAARGAFRLSKQLTVDMRSDVRVEFLEDTFEKQNVLLVVGDHLFDGGFLTFQDSHPEPVGGGFLLAHFEQAPDVVKAVGVEHEGGLGNLVGVNRRDRRERSEPMEQDAGLQVLGVEVVPVMGHDYVGR